MLICASAELIGRANLVYVGAPRQEQQVVYNDLRTTVEHHLASSKGLHGEAFRIGAAYRKYFVEPQDVAAGRLLASVKTGGWRFLLFCGTNAIGSTDCLCDSKSGKPLASGEFATNDYPVEAVSMAEKLPQTKERDYEVRLFAASFFHGLWLHSKSSDIFVPADNCYGKLEAFKPYSETQLIAVLQPYERTMIPVRMEASRQFERKLSMYEEAMVNYERSHGGERGRITPVMLEDLEDLSAIVQTFNLHGVSREGHELNYKVKVTYKDRNCLVMSRVEILEKLPVSN